LSVVNKYFESGFLNGFQKLPIDELVPPGILGFRDGVAFEEGDKRRGRTVIKQYEHRRTPSSG
jgi:hypothetical protein